MKTKQRLILITNCIVCKNPLSDHTLQKQDLNQFQGVSLVTCSSGCRTKYYRDKQDIAVIKEAIIKNDYSLIRNYKLNRIEDLGFKVLKIE